ncbi:hypothetical protein ACHAP5_011867, partial [Fusarium lateritium]
MSELSRADPDETLQSRVRRACEAHYDSPKEAFLERVWPELRESYILMVQALEALWKSYLEEEQIAADVRGRVKSTTSVRKSLERREKDRIEITKEPYKTIDEIFQDVHDLAGIRIIVDFAPHINKVKELINKTFQKTKEPSLWLSNRLAKDVWEEIFGAYEGYNYPVKFDTTLHDSMKQYCNVTVEIQVTSIAEALYNRLAHPLLYKSASKPLSRTEKGVIALSHGLALCYSVCLLIMQPRLEEASQKLKENPELLDTMREAAMVFDDEGEETTLDALNNQMRNDIPESPSGKTPEQDASISSSTSTPIHMLLSMLKASVHGEGTPDEQLEWMERRVMKGFASLPSCEDARFDSGDVHDSPKCHDGTMLTVRSRIETWVKDYQAPTVTWLHAPAGTGKSTLARTVAEDLMRSRNLAAGYFFGRGDIDRNHPSRVFPTIASQLSDALPAFGPRLRDSIQDRSIERLLKLNLEEQFRILIETPLTNMPVSGKNKPAKAIIIDALDECSDLSKLDSLLSLLASLRRLTSLRLCVLLTSRNVLRVSYAFDKLQDDGHAYITINHHREYKDESRTGIEQYLSAKFKEIKRRRKIQADPWPTRKDFKAIVREATTPSPLFIYASSLMSSIDHTNPTYEPTAQLQKWLSGCRQGENRLQTMYNRTLSDIVGSDAQQKSQVLLFLGSITALAKPLSLKALSGLLEQSQDTTSHWVRNLQSVLDVPEDLEEPIFLINRSLQDVLFVEQENTGQLTVDNSFTINRQEAHDILATKCLNRMMRQDGGLRKDRCNFSQKAIDRSEISGTAVSQAIPFDLQYACLYWVHHLDEAKRGFDRRTYEFLTNHFFHWIETLSSLGGVSEIRENINYLE